MERQPVAKTQKSASRSNPLQRQSAGPSSAGHPLLKLQRSIGNLAVQRLLRSYIQTKLQVSTPGDPFEQEADRVADTVMRMTEAELEATEGETPQIQAKPLATQITPLVQQVSEQPMEEEEEKTVAPKPLIRRVPVAVRGDDEEEKVAPKLEPGANMQEEEEEKPVQTKLETYTAIQRQAKEDEEKEEEMLSTAPPIQRQMEEEDEEVVQTKPLSGHLSQIPSISPVSTKSLSLPIQRLCAECADELAQTNPIDSRLFASRHVGAQRKEGPALAPQVTPSVSANIRALQSGGSPLPPATRGFFEPRFGADFSQVRVHTGSRATETARSINGKAFTVGQNIAFGSGQYAPASQEGRRLLAHELTHVVQQSTAVRGGLTVQRDARERSTPKDGPELRLSMEEWLINLMFNETDPEVLTILIEENVLGKGPEVHAALYARLSYERPPATDELAVTFNRLIKGKFRKKLLDRFKEGGRHYKPAARVVTAKLGAGWEKGFLDLMDQDEDQEMLAILIEGELLHAPSDVYAALYARLSPVDPPARDKLAVKFKRTFTGKTRQRLLDRFKEVGRHWDPVVPDPFPHLAPGIAPGRQTQAVRALGRIDAPLGVRLRERPAIQAGGPLVPFDTLVSIDRRTIEKKGQQSWLYVVALGDDYMGHNVTATGFVEEYFVAQKPPEPTAHLYQVRPGDMLKDIAARYYRHGFAWGNDARVYVQAIYHANKDRDVVFRQRPDLTVDRRALKTDNLADALKLWGEARVVAGQALWVPSNQFVQRLKAAGVIHHASISKELWDATAGAIQKLIDWAQYTAGFVIGLFQGAWDALSDLFTGVVDLIKALWSVVKALFGDWDDLKAFAKKLKTLWENRSEIVDQIITDFSKKWDAKDDYDRGNFQGETLGYIMMTAFIILVTFGAGAAIAGAGRLGNFIKLIQVLDKAQDITFYAGKLAKAAKLSGKVVDEARDSLKGRVSSVTKVEHPTGKPSPKPVPASGEKTTLAEIPAEGGHTVRIKKGGVVELCSEPPCVNITLVFQETLKQNKELAKTFKSIRSRAQQAERMTTSADPKLVTQGEKLLKEAGADVVRLQSKLAKTGITRGGIRYRPEPDLLGEGRHGLEWKPSDAVERAQKTGNPQGKFGGVEDIQYATEMAAQLGPGQHNIFPLPGGNRSRVFLPDGSEVPATRVFVLVRQDGSYHAYPL